jgi:hypothetical protein
VTNLIDNAVRHNVPGGEVQVATGTSRAGAVLSVASSGQLIPPAATAATALACPSSGPSPPPTPPPSPRKPGPAAAWPSTSRSPRQSRRIPAGRMPDARPACRPGGRCRARRGGRRRLSVGTWRDSGGGALLFPCLTRNPFAGIRRVAGD